MRRWFLILITLAPLVALAPQVSAHFPATDGTMTVILHVDPDDAPVATQPASLNFIFDDDNGNFSVANCACSLSVSEQGKPLYFSAISAPSGKPSVYGATVPFTFPKPDVYQISMQGQPIAAGSFQPFSVSWNMRVDRPVEPGGFSLSSFLKYFGAILGCLVLVGSLVYLLDPRGRK